MPKVGEKVKPSPPLRPSYEMFKTGGAQRGGRNEGNVLVRPCFANSLSRMGRAGALSKPSCQDLDQVGGLPTRRGGDGWADRRGLQPRV